MSWARSSSHTCSEWERPAAYSYLRWFCIAAVPDGVIRFYIDARLQLVFPCMSGWWMITWWWCNIWYVYQYTVERGKRPDCWQTAAPWNWRFWWLWIRFLYWEFISNIIRTFMRVFGSECLSHAMISGFGYLPMVWPFASLYCNIFVRLANFGNHLFIIMAFPYVFIGLISSSHFNFSTHRARSFQILILTHADRSHTNFLS